MWQLFKYARPCYWQSLSRRVSCCQNQLLLCICIVQQLYMCQRKPVASCASNNLAHCLQVVKYGTCEKLDQYTHFFIPSGQSPAAGEMVTCIGYPGKLRSMYAFSVPWAAGYLASHQSDAERRNIFLSFLFSQLACCTMHVGFCILSHDQYISGPAQVL